MEAIQTMITDALGPFGPLMIVGLLGVFLILITLPVLLKREVDPLDKLKASARSDNAKTAKGEKLRSASGKDKLEKYSNFLLPHNEELYSAANLHLLQAGYRSPNAVRIFHFVQFALGIFGLLAGGIYAMIQASQTTVETSNLILMIGAPGAIGYILPKYWVSRRRATRQQEITNGFPDSLDMMLVCVEA